MRNTKLSLPLDEGKVGGVAARMRCDCRILNETPYQKTIFKNILKIKFYKKHKKHKIINGVVQWAYVWAV